MCSAEKEFSSKPNENRVKQGLDRLYEDEALTDALDDNGAKALLDWGERFFKGLDINAMTSEQFEGAVQKGMNIMRSVNRISSQRMDLSDEGFIQQLTEILDSARFLNL